MVTYEGFNRVSLVIAVAAFYAVMLDLCEDRPSCAVKASPETFTQDPCEGTSKYLEVHYKCRPNQFERQTVCEGTELQIACGRGDRIAVYSAMYGRTPNGTDQCPANKQGFIDCQALGAVSEVRSQCHGRRNCAILANESVFGDPCAAGINKYLTVSYACVPKKILKQFHRKNNKKKKKRKKKKRKKKKGRKDDVIEVTTEAEETSPGLPPHTPTSRDQGDQSTVSEVYETFEQSSVTQMLPGPGTDSPFDNNIGIDASVDQHKPDPDITTIQDEAVLPDATFTRGPVTPSSDLKDHPKYHHTTDADKDSDGASDDGDDVTDASISSSSFDVNADKKEPGSAYNTKGDDPSDNDDTNVFQPVDKFDDGGEDSQTDDTDNQSSNPGTSSNDGSNNNNNNNNIDNLGRVINNKKPGATVPTNNSPLGTTLNPRSRDTGKDQGSGSDSDPNQVPNPTISKDGPEPGSPYVTERNLTVLCINYTRPEVRWGGLPRPTDERTIGFLKDWFSILHFLKTHEEKAWLYFTLGICFGIIVMLIVILVKVCINFRRNIRARLDVSEPTHRSAHTNNHALDAPMLEHSDSIDRIEVVRFSPRSTLRSVRSNSHHRDLVNYYG